MCAEALSSIKEFFLKKLQTVFNCSKGFSLLVSIGDNTSMLLSNELSPQ